LHRAFNNPPKRRGVEDVGGVVGIDDVDVAAGVNYVGKVLDGSAAAMVLCFGGDHGAR